MKNVVVRLALVGAAMTAILICGGCRKRESFFTRSKPAPPASTSTIPTPPKQTQPALRQQAVETVSTYITALGEHNYTAAHAMLAEESRAQWAPNTFIQQAKQGMPLYDLNTASATVTGNTALVAVQQLEDPATHGFHLIREKDLWKIVYRGGIPGQPYGE